MTEPFGFKIAQHLSIVSALDVMLNSAEYTARRNRMIISAAPSSSTKRRSTAAINKCKKRKLVKQSRRSNR